MVTICTTLYNQQLHGTKELRKNPPPLNFGLSENYRNIFTRESNYCFQCVLAIAILSVSLSVTQVDQSKMV